MSGIAGIFYLDERTVQNPEIASVTDALRFRGPDGFGVWRHGPIGLGHTSFRTTPQSLADKQPLWRERQGLAITCDARIDNHEELKRLLSLDGPADEISESEMILRAYAAWGQHCPERLIGDFSFAIWDAKNRSLFCARDRFGVKPFCYCYVPGHLFAFASQVGALLQLPIPRHLNEWLIVQLFEPTFEGLDQTATFYRDILKLGASSSMKVSRGGIERRRYWSLDPTCEIRLRSSEEYIEAYREIFSEAVRCRTRATGEPGILLSGGIDSSSIAGEASRILGETGKRLHTLSGVCEIDCPEEKFIRAVVRALPVCPHFVQSNEAAQYANDFEHAVLNAAEPTEPTRNYMPRVLYRAAQRAGLRIVMTGTDGDMATSHDFPIPYLLRAGRWKSAVALSRAAARREKMSTWTVLRCLGLRPIAPHFVTRSWDILRRRRRWRTQLLAPEFARRIDLAARLEQLQREWFDLKPHIRYNATAFLSCGILPFAYEQCDLTTAAMGVEPRHPYSDHRLVEFCLSVPWEEKLWEGYSKALLRRAADSRIPDEVRWRTERPSSGMPFVLALLNTKREILEEGASHFDLLASYLNVPELHAAWERFRGTFGPGDAPAVTSAIYLGLWLHRNAFN